MIGVSVFVSGKKRVRACAQARELASEGVRE